MATQGSWWVEFTPDGPVTVWKEVEVVAPIDGFIPHTSESEEQFNFIAVHGCDWPPQAPLPAGGDD